MFLDQWQNTIPNGHKLFCWSQFPWHRSQVFDIQHLFDTRDSDHEEFVEVRGNNREKFESFKKWGCVVGCLFEHASEKLQLTQVLIENCPREEMPRLDFF